jgi:hypothetical protein
MSEDTFIRELAAFGDRLLPFRVRNGKIGGGVPGFDKLGVNADRVMGEKEVD